MSEIKKNFEPKVGSERSFGYTFAYFFYSFFILIYHNNELNYYLILISIFFLIVTFIKPLFFKNLTYFGLN